VNERAGKVARVGQYCAATGLPNRLARPGEAAPFCGSMRMETKVSLIRTRRIIIKQQTLIWIPSLSLSASHLMLGGNKGLQRSSQSNKLPTFGPLAQKYASSRLCWPAKLNLMSLPPPSRVKPSELNLEHGQNPRTELVSLS